MRVLVTGASGFIGRRLVDALQAAGHQPVAAVRDVEAARQRWPGLAVVAIDFGRDHDPAVWRPRLAGIDAVVNAVGLFQPQGQQSFESVHVRAPEALFAACVDCGVRRVVQLSALGADRDAATGYHLSKKQADDCLRSLPLVASVVQPSLVFGADGTSSRMLLRLASLPLPALPAGGRQWVQPLHVDDLAAAVVALLEHPDPPPQLAATGPAALTLRDYLQCLRNGLGLGRLRVLPLPMPLARRLARLAARWPGSLLTPDSLAMLERGNRADSAAITALLGAPPRECGRFIDAPARAGLRDALLLQPALRLLRFAIAAVWIATALVSFGLYPVADSFELLARSGVPTGLQPLALYGAATLDLLIGLGMLLLPARWRPPLYLAQAALVLGYSAIIALRLPEFLLHPYAPILKNLPLLAGLWLLFRLERR
jgi:uncharacterized protein YbjT (DUF2867 family)